MLQAPINFEARRFDVAARSGLSGDEKPFPWPDEQWVVTDSHEACLSQASASSLTP